MPHRQFRMEHAGVKQPLTHCTRSVRGPVPVLGPLLLRKRGYYYVLPIGVLQGRTPDMPLLSGRGTEFR